MRIFEHASYPFLSWRRRAFIVTAVLLVLTVGAMVRNMMDPSLGSWLNYGVDFTGGTIVQVSFNQPTDVEQIRAVSGANAWEIYRYGSENDFMIRMASFAQGTEQDAREVVRRTLGEAFGDGTFQIVRTEGVGPKVGAELQQKALLAIVLSLGATMIYLAVRFEWRFGVAAVVATTHDILITLGFLAMMRSEISLGTVAALLTIVGYSLNDTIVVFDRIRENLGLPHRGQSFAQIVDRSVNETLPRTVLTGVSTLGTLFALLIFGGPVIRDFALVLILGIVIGTFSSIFVASPVLYLVEQRWPRPTTRGANPGTPPRRTSAAV
jgi:preprotein translocase subunit SecF